MQRDLSVYINEIYVPSSFIVGLSFISFFIDYKRYKLMKIYPSYFILCFITIFYYKSAAARAPLGATSILTITTMVDGILDKLIRNFSAIIFCKIINFKLGT